MIVLVHPWLLLVVLLAVIVRRTAPAHQESRIGLLIPFMERLERASGVKPQSSVAVARRTKTQSAVICISWILIVIALARPQWLGEAQTKMVPTRDLLLAVDLSGSMDTKDFHGPAGEEWDRLSAVKYVLDDFLTRRKDDRVGLLLFGSAPFVQVPFTEDTEVCRLLLGEAQVGMAGNKTMIGDAIGLAINVFERSALEERVLILLTDGNDSGSKVPPENAARLAADYGVVIHTIAVGDPNATGQDSIQADRLKNVSEVTGGRFFHASDRVQLAEIYVEIDAMKTGESEVISHRPRSELYHWPLGAAFFLVLVFHVWRSLAPLGVAAERHPMAEAGRAVAEP